MLLLLEVGGLLAAAAIVTALMRNLTGAPAIAPAAATVVLVVAAATAVSQTWSSGKALDDRGLQARTLSEDQAAVAGGAVFGVNVAFIEWVRGSLRPGETFSVVIRGGPVGDPAAYQWITYRLLPNQAADEASEANVLVFYGVPPGGTQYGFQRFDRIISFDQNFAIARAG